MKWQVVYYEFGERLAIATCPTKEFAEQVVRVHRRVDIYKANTPSYFERSTLYCTNWISNYKIEQIA